jgi:hypothetical protein
VGYARFCVLRNTLDRYDARACARQGTAATFGGLGVIGVLRRLASARERVATPERLADFLAARAAFVSQKSSLDYCRARAGLSWAQLFREDEFGRAIERCRWEAYAAVLADVGEVALIYLRHRGFDGPQLAAALGEVLRAALVRHPIPAHRASWEDAVELARARLHRALLAPPRPVHRVGRMSGRRVFEVLPIHTNLKAHDREMVVNNIRFLLCRVYADMEAALDGAALGRALTVAPGDAPAAVPGHRGGAPPAPP